MKLDSRTINVYLAFGLIVAVVWIVADCEGDRNSDLSEAANENRYQSEIAMRDKEIARREAFELQQDSARKVDSLQHKRTQDSLQAVINRVYRRIIPTPTLAETAPDTCKHLIAQLEKRDSVISLTNAITGDLKKQVSEQGASYERSLDSLEANVQAEKKKFELADSERDSLRNLRKPSRWSISLSAGPGIVWNPVTGRIHGGVIFGPTVSYKINFRKKGD